MRSDNSQFIHEVLETRKSILALAVSPDGKTIALGYGGFSLLWSVNGSGLLRPQKIFYSKDLPKGSVRGQKMNFSADSKRLVSCIQVSRTPQKHDMYAAIWVNSAEGFELETELDAVELSVVSSWRYVNFDRRMTVNRVTITMKASRQRAW